MRRRLRSSAARSGAPSPPPWNPIGPRPPGEPEVVAFYGEDAIVAGHPEDTCTPSFWLDFPPGTVTTIIMQVWNDPWMVAYAHSHNIRVLQAAGGPCEGYTNTSGAAMLANATYRSELVAQFNQSIRVSGLDGWGWDIEETDPLYQPHVALFIQELRRACPEAYQAFYTQNLVGKGTWLAWEAEPMKLIAANVDMIIASTYTESNDTAPDGPGIAPCSRPCGTTSLPTVKGALHGTNLPNGTVLRDSWTDIGIPKEKMVLALGWFHQQWLSNMTKSPWPWSSPSQLGRRISFCQAVALYESLGENRESLRQWDAESNTWHFNCEHDAANESTFQSCGPWPGASQPITTQVWYDDAVSSEAKFAAVKAAGWRGIGFWQASGMWPGDTVFFNPYDNSTDVSVYCKKDVQELWTMVGKYFGQKQ